MRDLPIDVSHLKEPILTVAGLVITREEWDELDPEATEVLVDMLREELGGAWPLVKGQG